MKTGAKVLIIGGTLGVGAGLIYLTTRPAQAAPPGGGAGAGQTGTLKVTLSPASTVLKISGAQIPAGTYEGVNTGTFSWTASASGYKDASGTVTIKANQTTPLDIVMVAAGGGGGGGSAAFQMTVLNASSYRSWPVAVWNAVKVSVDLKNTGQAAQTHTITIWKKYTVNGQTTSPQPVSDTNGANLATAVTLQAGTGTTLSLDSGQYSIVFPYGYSATCDIWVQDELGNKSNVVTIS
jgi:hypothetical protein